MWPRSNTSVPRRANPFDPTRQVGSDDSSRGLRRRFPSGLTPGSPQSSPQRMILMHPLRTLAILTALLSIATTARGGFVTGTITGTVTAAGSALSGIAVGSVVAGSYTYDDSVTVNQFLGDEHPFTAFSLIIGTNP